MSRTTNRDSFENLGYVFCPTFQSAEQMDEIHTNLKRVINNVVPKMPAEHVFYEDKNNPETLKQLQELQHHDEFFSKLMCEGAFRELAETLLGTEVVCKNMQYFNKPPGVGLPTPAHQDGYYFKLKPCNALTMWMALEPVDEENGCIRYVPKSHRQGMRPHGSTETLGFSQGITDFPTANDSANEIAFPAGPGDLLAHHALTIHRADGNKSESRTRRALGFIYYSVDAIEDTDAKNNYQSDLKSKLTESGKI